MSAAIVTVTGDVRSQVMSVLLLFLRIQNTQKSKFSGVRTPPGQFTVLPETP